MVAVSLKPTTELDAAIAEADRGEFAGEFNSLEEFNQGFDKETYQKPKEESTGIISHSLIPLFYGDDFSPAFFSYSALIAQRIFVELARLLRMHSSLEGRMTSFEYSE